ncbi:MAG: helix-turn-helix transcriptional regulator [Candidatus Cryptobacteroides sp.]
MEDVYMLSDSQIMKKMGEKLKATRLRQNITQLNLSKRTNVPLSTVKRIEKGENCTMENVLRIMRELGALDIFHAFVEEEQLSPNEYYNLVYGNAKPKRKRAVGGNVYPVHYLEEEGAEW